MNWEVSTMLSKRSFFNPVLFQKNLTRFWPLWGGLSLLGSLAPLYMLLALLSGAGRNLGSLDFTFALYEVTASAGPVVFFLYAIICAALVWSYLYNPRAVGLMHTLPAGRTCLFVTGVLSGLTMLLIPCAVVGALVCLIALSWGFFDLMAVANTVLAILLLALIFFGLATFCAMLTGYALALPVLYGLVNFLAPLLEALIVSLSSEFLIGLEIRSSGWTIALSPVIKLTESLSVRSITELEGERGVVTGYLLDGFGVLGLWGLAGAALLGLAWLLYRLRSSESAGDAAAFPWLRPVFRYGLSLLSALTLGRLLYELIRAALFLSSRYANRAVMAVCMALAAVVGYYIASMLLEKSLRVFRGSARGVALATAAAAAVCLLASYDLFGAERRVPELEEISQVEFYDNGLYLLCTAAEDPELLAQIRDLHQTIVADRDYVRSAADYPSNVPGQRRYHSLRLTYTLRNGTRLKRYYAFWVLEGRVADPSTYDGKLAALFSAPQVILDQFALQEGGVLTGMHCLNHYEGAALELDGEQRQRVYEAMLRDAREGNLPGRSVLGGEPEPYAMSIELQYRTPAQPSGYDYGYKEMQVYPTMMNTLHTLLELELVSREQLEQWDEELGISSVLERTEEGC